MSHSGDRTAEGRGVSPGSLKRKRESFYAAPDSSPIATATKSARLTNGEKSLSREPRRNSAATNGTQYTSPVSDELQPSEHGDLLRGVGSASSLGSTTSSIFSHNPHSASYHRNPSLANGLTPDTHHTDSPPPKGNSPSYPKAVSQMTGSNGAVTAAPGPPSDAPLKSIEQRKQRPQMLPPPGKVKGYRAVWDPELDGKLSKEERKRATTRRREFGTEAYPPDPPPDPRLAIPGYQSGNCRSRTQPSKAILRIAPYTLPPFKIDRYSIGPGEAEQVVAVGFDPFLPEPTLRLNFSTFGSVASVQNKTDPETGSFLGIALIKYRDSVRDGQDVTAVAAARRAEAEFNGARIGLHTIKVEIDREGRRCKRHVDHALRKTREARAQEQGAVQRPAPPPDVAISAKDTTAPPPNAPKGPSGRPSIKPPEGPRATALPPFRAGPTSLIEEEPILNQIKRKPYIHIAHTSVPVLGTTIPHLKKRLKAFDWREVRLDKTGYYVIFEDSKRGEDETERCFSECHNGALFTYTMAMECQKYGNPDYERSPSPERAQAEKKRREEFERLQRDEIEDIEVEKKNRAENLDPVQGAVEQLRSELRDKIMGDIKTRIAIPIFHDSLEPARHVAVRRKLGLPDPSDNENKVPTLLFSKTGDILPHSPKSRSGYSMSHAKPLRPHDPNQQRGRKPDRDARSGNAFADERRRKPAPRPTHARGLHFRLQQMFGEEEDSDDEHHTSITHDTEDQESRPLSRASRTSTPADSESVAGTPQHKRRKVGEWDDDEKEIFEPFHKEMLGHLLHKEPEDLATRELELVVNTLPRSSKYATRAKTELFIRQRSKADDDLFQVKSEPKSEPRDDVQLAEPGLETLASGELDAKAVKDKAKKKRKTKKQILEEQEALKVEAEEAKDASLPVTHETAAEIAHKDLELEAIAEHEDQSVDLSLTYDRPRRTVEDDWTSILDIDGWQEFLKDNDDLAYAKKVLSDEVAYDLGDPFVWAWKQKEIKALNSVLVPDHVRSQPLIQGYYVPNPTGCARTEGVKKILNEEKSKYLPHRIKVQKQREQRQALAKANPTAAAEASKLAAAEKFASTATSRSNRVNNRRLVNDINLQKQNLATVNSEADVAFRFNQLKKRKKLVKFDRSAIHGWGLYAEENIAVNDLIIEYVGEKVRQKVADIRELKYEKQGIGSSYLFRMVDDEIVDATKKGGIARFINHSCNPNCTAKIIKVEGTPRIVIYALADILKNEELTYDYKFEREWDSLDRIPCLCGSANCKGFLN